ncbi:MAG: DUF11 domain-containing protein [Mesorhizobium sp.]|uniref:DUF7929 domain-containing protein n=1 Tax=Mesorhizobium sp. TaxID=1871066 RepID=UPI000FEA69D0|nr:hypothetical protein [Mesorhizobium sp.]RWM07308.1 MAG: DUF11 domain-containing protein [Mesorhizobium sp.]TIO50460.1 MAG: DUF11 domain-containing protein [Mesorhizobium sp.]TIO60028.1 MAG: DUF11 domain-containing protein [Mesorhizobium sp.]TJV62702.1 MAG: DUF11 domain-containing protein [Mesorhizobium sp.]
MSDLALSRFASRKTIMETIMKPLSYARRGARWLMAAGIAVAMMPASLALAQNTAPSSQAANQPRGINSELGRIIPFFTKKGGQRSCDTVEYVLSFGIHGDPQDFDRPSVAALLKATRLDFKDQLPHGLQIVGVDVAGDGTSASGGPLPAASISSSAGPNDAASVSNFRISASNLDGAGAANERIITFRITAKIDHATFPVPATVDNQGEIKVSLRGGPATTIPSQDPDKPDDGDFLTGVKTSIKIDLTKCNPPPPPPGKECFKVERGTVDCVPGGGAFIYHMPVGPEMGGKWVQVSTTTPGVAIVPDTQQVPAGGGLLDWKIIGASPGEAIHLVVTGIETYAGPKEGWGLCCTQTIDIVIPRDIRCPPEQPDLKVEKWAEVPRCTMAGGCDFTITVTNVGDAPYNGTIVLDEVTLPAGSVLSSGPNPPWICVPGAPPMTCTHPVTTLNPGASVNLKLGFKPAAGWQGSVLRNCATYDYHASGKPLFGSQQNDRACASIPICRRGDRDPRCQPPVEKKVDLILKKRARVPVCTPDGICTFVIDIINNGTSTYNGPLTVVDTYPGGAPTSSTFGPSPPWTCGPNGLGQFRCDNAGISLPPGASTPIVVKAVMPANYRPDRVENCAEVKAISGEVDLANNKSCATERIRHPNGGQPGLRITKVCDGSLAGAAVVSCRITVSNAGTAAPTGPVRVSDAATLVSGGAPVAIQTVTPDGADWSCGPVPANTLSCQIPGAVMTPGESRHFDVTVSANGAFENCARGSYGPAPGDDIVYPIGQACAKGGGASIIRVEKTGDAECRAGAPCSFEISITNDGPNAFSGPVRIGDAIGIDGLGRLEGVQITSIDPPFGCSPEPATLPASCIANLVLGAGESRTHHVTVVLPNDGRLANLQGTVSGQNCVGVLSPNTPVQGGDVLSRAPTNAQGDRGKAYACHPFTISQEVKNQCSNGMVLNSAGRCACPEGTTFRNGQCSGGGVIILPEPKEPKRCVLLKGQIRTADGRCVCPRGTELANGRCVASERPEEPQCTLRPGQYRDQDGNCVCRRGELVNGVCEVVPPKCTIRGAVPTADGCVCPKGTHLDRVARACVPDRQPPSQCRIRGQVRNADGDCVCPKGTELRGKACAPVKKPQACSIRGQVLNKRGACVCPRGTEVIDGACRRVDAECAPGSQMIDGICQPIIRRRCPVGTTGRYPDCFPIRRRPGLEINPNLLLNPNILQQLVPQRQPRRVLQDPAGANIQNFKP